MNLHWSPAQDDTLRRLYVDSGNRPDAIVDATGASSWSACQARAKKLGITRKPGASRVFTPQMDETLRRMWAAGEETIQIALECGVGLTCLGSRRAALGLPARRSTAWTAENDAALKLAWETTRRSTAEIGAELGVTKNQVIRRIHARKLVRPAPEPKPAPVARVARPRPAPVPTPPATACKPDPVPAAPATSAPLNVVPFMALKRHTCRWSFGDPLKDGFGFCPDHAQAGQPYCTRHIRAAYAAPVAPRADRARS